MRRGLCCGGTSEGCAEKKRLIYIHYTFQRQNPSLTLLSIMFSSCIISRVISMNNELEKIDVIRSRYKVSYEEARNVLSCAEGDLVSALVAIEKSPQSTGTDLLSLGAEMADEVQRLVGSGPISKLRVKYGSKLVAEMPVALTAAAALAVGVAAVLISRLIIEVERGEGEATN